MADAHYRLVKDVGADGRATTRIEPVEGEELIAELCRMLGATPTDAGARRHAEELLWRDAVAGGPAQHLAPRVTYPGNMPADAMSVPVSQYTRSSRIRSPSISSTLTPFSSSACPLPGSGP